MPTTVGQIGQVSTPEMEKKSTPAELSRALRRAMGGITQSELATKLLLSRNYISHIEAGIKLPSIRILAQMEAMLTEATSPGAQKQHLPLGPEQPLGDVEEPPAPYLPSGAGGLSDSALAITEQIQAKVFSVVRAANGDPSRLGWINEQLDQHLRPPATWPKVGPKPALDLPPLTSGPARPQPARQRGTANG